MIPHPTQAPRASRILRLASLVCTLAAASPRADAAIPPAATSDPLYAKGYLNVAYYNGVPSVPTETFSTRTTRKNSINTALADAYANKLALYFPADTYEINDALKAHTDTAGTGGSTFTTPNKHLVMIGSTSSVRPLIKLVVGTGAGFEDANAPKAVVEFKNFDDLSSPNPVEKASQGYFQMIRGIDIDCSGHPGAVGLYFDQAQNSSIENVKVTATGSFAGIQGLPGRGWGAVNIEVEGGSYGIDTDNGGAGTVIAGAILRNQTLSAVRQRGFVPMVLVGFEIVTPASATTSVKIESAISHNAACLALIDGRITVADEPTIAVIDNSAGTSLYVRNVSITGGTKLVKSAGLTTLTGTGTWKRIAEYGYCNQSAADIDLPAPNPDRITQVLLADTVSQTAQTQNIISGASAPSADIVTRHRWAALPSVDDPDAVDASTLGINPGNVVSSTFQTVINQNRKIFLRAGIYKLDGPITLGADTILFGAGRSLTRIENQPGYDPGSETALVSTVSDANATTHLGDLTIGIYSDDDQDFLTALNWKAGRNSMVHMGQPYKLPDDANPPLTAAHSLLKIDGGGGGRWYFAGAIRPGRTDNPGFRYLKVTGTTQPLWFYGLNLEHALGSDMYAEFTNVSNVRIYVGKSEFTNSGSAKRGDSVLIRFTGCTNVAQFGQGAIRNAVKNHGVIEFIDCDDVLAALINPQNDDDSVGLNAQWHTLRQTVSGASVGVRYPNCVALFKRGALSDGSMAHDDVFYGPEMIFTSIAAQDGWVLETNETSNQGGSFNSTATGGLALLVGDSDVKQQYRSLVSFNTAALPDAADAEIFAATLELRRGSAAGAFLSGNLNALGAMRADLKTGNFGTSAVEVGDFQAAATASNVIPSFPVPAVNFDWAIGAIDTTGLAAINRTGNTQFRVYFATDDNNNGTADTVGFYSADNATPANRPVLRVQYRQPE